MCSSCCSNLGWLHMPSAVLLNWFTPNILLLNHSFGCNRLYKVYIKMLHSAAIWKAVAQKIKGGDGIWSVVVLHMYSQLLAVGERQVLTSEGENAQTGVFIAMVFESTGETWILCMFSALHRDSWCFTHCLQVSEMQMFLEWKVAAVGCVKQQAGKGMLAGTREETVLITRK